MGIWCCNFLSYFFFGQIGLSSSYVIKTIEEEVLFLFLFYGVTFFINFMINLQNEARGM